MSTYSAPATSLGDISTQIHARSYSPITPCTALLSETQRNLASWPIEPITAAPVTHHNSCAARLERAQTLYLQEIDRNPRPYLQEMANIFDEELRLTVGRSEGTPYFMTPPRGAQPTSRIETKMILQMQAYTKEIDSRARWGSATSGTTRAKQGLARKRSEIFNRIGRKFRFR